MYEQQIPQNAIAIMKRLEEAGYEAYLVGGCVRDLLLGRVPHDFDITTNALPDEVEALFDGAEMCDAVKLADEECESGDAVKLADEECESGDAVKSADDGGETTDATADTAAATDDTDVMMDDAASKKARWHTVPIGKEHGTIGVVAPARCDNAEMAGDHGSLQPELYEVTTYRIDGAYSDNRHPDQVTFTRRLEDDLRRRDFTVNALAMDREGAVADFVGGREDLASEVLRAVGSPAERFDEDALRILRGIRFAAQLSGTEGAPSGAAPSDMPSGAPSGAAPSDMPSGAPSGAAPSDMPSGAPSGAAPSDKPSCAAPSGFRIEPATAAAIHERKHLLHNIAAERIRAELDKVLLAPGAVTVLREYRDVFAEFIPELAQGFDFDQQNPYHCYDVYEHTLHAVDAVPRTILPPPIAATEEEAVATEAPAAAEDSGRMATAVRQGFTAADNDRAYLTVRLAALLHDVGKPACFLVKRDRGHFYGHERLSADMAADILSRLRYDNRTRSDVDVLIRAHGTVVQLEERYARHKLNQFGEERLRMLLALERADVSAQAEAVRGERIDTIDRFVEMVDQVVAEEQCFSVRDLAVDGHDLIALGIPAGPAIGDALSVLLENVIDGKIENDKTALLALAAKLLNKK